MLWPIICSQVISWRDAKRARKNTSESMTMSLTLIKVPQHPRKESFAYTHRLGTFLKGEPGWRGLFAKRYLEIRNLKWPLGPETSDKNVYMLQSTEKSESKTTLDPRKSSQNGLPEHILASFHKEWTSTPGSQASANACPCPLHTLNSSILYPSEQIKIGFSQGTSSAAGQSEGTSLLSLKVFVHVGRRQMNTLS